MKTTLELPDALLVEAKATAASRRTTLKAIMEHALRRELGILIGREDKEGQDIGEKSATQLNDYGFPVLKREKSDKSRGKLTSEMVYAMQDQEDYQ